MSFTLTVDVEDFTPRLLKVCADKLNRSFLLALSSIKREGKRLIREALIASPENGWLSSGEIRGAVGLENPTAAIKDVILAVEQSVTIYIDRVRVVGRNLAGGLTMVASRKDFSDAMSAPSAFFVSERSVVVPWLRWMLFEGSNEVISDYYFRASPAGRTGQGVMRKTKKGIGYSVPPLIQGSPASNWLTRAFGGMGSKFAQVMVTEIGRVW